MNVRMLVLVNLLLLGTFVAVRAVDAQTPPNRAHCCKTNSEQKKYCCEDCCTGTDGCTATSQCTQPDE